MNQDLASWQRPSVYSPSAWLKTCWQNARYSGADVPALLSGPQEHALWRRIIEEQTPGLFDIESTAALASRAAGLIAEWHIPLESDAWNEHQDGQQFRNWLAALRTVCKQEGWICSADLWHLVPKWIRTGVCDSEAVVFAGFSNFTPAMRRVREALGSSAKVLTAEGFERPTTVPVTACKDFSEEIEAAARFARAVIERGSESSVGVFVPELAKHFGLVERIFEQICYPSGHRSESVFHLHAGAPLRESPIIAGALLLLRAAQGRIPVGEAGAILRSPWIKGAAQERNERALADMQLRRSRELDVNLNDLEYAARFCPQFQERLRGVRMAIREKPAKAEFAAWSESFSDVVAAFGWPGDTDVDPAEQDLIEAWNNKLSVLASLSVVTLPVTFEEALARLRSVLEDQNATVGDFFSPVQILDARTATGLRFDAAFLAGLSENNGFVNASVSPLIPLKLQRACGVPGTSPRSLHERRDETISDLFVTAPQISASYSGRILPAAQKYLSAQEDESPRWQGQTPIQSFVAAEMQQIEDTNAPPYTPGNRSLGGTGLIKDQSQCPFRAFAIRRLNARCPEDASFGLDSRDRGGFVHEALRIIWDQLKTQEELQKIKPLELQFLVHDAVKSAVDVKERGPLHQQLSLAERNRLAEVILAWLEVERQRKRPFRVEVTEQGRALDIAGLHLDIRIDRIDRLPNGKCLLIDYKSGETAAKNLLGERPKEPQLLAYAAAVHDEVDGVFFAQLKPRDPQLVGFARDVHIQGQKPPSKAQSTRMRAANQEEKPAALSGARLTLRPFRAGSSQDLDWDEYLEDRIAVIERLAESFVGGEAAVDPLPGACEYCDVKPMCRIHEVQRARMHAAKQEERIGPFGGGFETTPVLRALKSAPEQKRRSS